MVTLLLSSGFRLLKACLLSAQVLSLSVLAQDAE